MKKKNLIITIALLLAFSIPIGVKAFSTQAANSIYVGENEIITGNLYAASQNITIDGRIEGDLIATSRIININGEIEGDIIALASDISVNGKVGGNIRTLSKSIQINGEVKRNVDALAPSVIINKDGLIGWDLFLVTQTGDIRGGINGNLHGYAENIVISGKINEDVNLTLENERSGAYQSRLSVNDGAQINGDLKYKSSNVAVISEQSQVKGNINRLDVNHSDYLIEKVWKGLHSILAALIIGLLLLFFWRKHITKIIKDIRGREGRALSWGLAILFLTPIISFIVAITIIGFPLSIIIMGLWLMLIYLAKIITAVILGYYLGKKVLKKNSEKLFWEMAVGIIILWILFSLPIIGWMITLIAIWLGLGAIYLHLNHLRK